MSPPNFTLWQSPLGGTIAAQVAIAGDFLPAGKLSFPGHAGWRDVANPLASHFEDTTISFANLESVLDASGLAARPLTGLGDIVSAPVDCLDYLEEIHARVIGIANNHTYDFEAEGVARTRRAISERGMIPLGAGCDLRTAPEVSVWRRPEKVRVGFWAAARATSDAATRNSPGIEPATAARGLKALDAMKQQGAHFCIALLHAGCLRTNYPDPEDVRLMDGLAQIGFDIVAASHSHRIGGAKILRDENDHEAFCFYGLGSIASGYVASPRERGTHHCGGTRFPRQSGSRGSPASPAGRWRLWRNTVARDEPGDTRPLPRGFERHRKRSVRAGVLSRHVERAPGPLRSRRTASIRSIGSARPSAQGRAHSDEAHAASGSQGDRMNAAGAASCIVAFASSAILTPVARQICIRFGVLDRPGPLKIHAQPIPRLGGVVITLAIIGATVAGKLLPSRSSWSFIAALALVWSAGLIDDVRGLSPAFRLAAQATGALLLWRSGWNIPAFGSGAWNILATCLFVIVFANAFNFLDGTDGLAAGVAGIIALAYIFAQSGLGLHFANNVAWSLLGACTGFLLFNFPPAKIFMGDSGSTALGFSVAFLGLDFFRSSGGTTPSLVFPVLLAGLPLIDAGLAVVRRLQHRASPFYGDRRHFYDLLLARRWSARRVAFACYAITAGLGAIGWIGLRSDSRLFLLLAAMSFAALLLAALRLGSLRIEEPKPRGQRSAAQNLGGLGER